MQTRFAAYFWPVLGRPENDKGVTTMKSIRVLSLATIAGVEAGTCTVASGEATRGEYFPNWNLFAPAFSEEAVIDSCMPAAVEKRLREFTSVLEMHRAIIGDPLVRWFKNARGEIDAEATAQPKGKPGTWIVLARWHSADIHAPESVSTMQAIVEARKQLLSRMICVVFGLVGLSGGLMLFLGYHWLVPVVSGIVGFLLGRLIRNLYNDSVREKFVKGRRIELQRYIWALET